MKPDLQIITGKNGEPEFAVVPIATYKKLLAAAEDADDVRLAEAAETIGGEQFPADVAKRIIAGESPIRVYRKYRGIKQKDLAAIVDTAPEYLSQIECGRREAGKKLLRKIAAALDLEIADLI